MLKIYGESDVLVELEGIVHDEICSYDKATHIDVGGVLRVTAEYAPGDEGNWQFSVIQIEEGDPLPWPVRIERQHEYSLAVVIDCPEGTTVEYGGEDVD